MDNNGVEVAPAARRCLERRTRHWHGPSSRDSHQNCPAALSMQPVWQHSFVLNVRRIRIGDCGFNGRQGGLPENRARAGEHRPASPSLRVPLPATKFRLLRSCGRGGGAGAPFWGLSVLWGGGGVLRVYTSSGSDIPARVVTLIRPGAETTIVRQAHYTDSLSTSTSPARAAGRTARPAARPAALPTGSGALRRVMDLEPDWPGQLAS